MRGPRWDAQLEKRDIRDILGPVGKSEYGLSDRLDGNIFNRNVEIVTE